MGSEYFRDPRPILLAEVRAGVRKMMDGEAVARNIPVW